MFISTNLSGPAGIPRPDAVRRPGSNFKPGGSTPSPSGVPVSATLNPQINRAAELEAQDGNAARDNARLARSSVAQNPALAMLAQANLSPESVLNLLQE